MYKLLLSWRYLRTRYIALASIISVTLGVGTLIVVNSVMAGFTREMHVRLHGILSDIIIESHSLDGLVDPAWHMAEVRKVVGDDLVGITQAVHVPAMLSMSVRGQMSTRQITLIGVDEATGLVIQPRTSRLSVLGESYVVACFPGAAAHPQRIEILKAGDDVTLPQLRHDHLAYHPVDGAYAANGVQ
jgi:ABC-type lipoprotein release transport system permease subunit